MYLDDVISFGKTVPEAIGRLEEQLPCYSVCFKYIQRYTSMNCFKFTHDIDEILENPMMYFIIYVLLMETCLKRFITGIISPYLNFSVVV